jgi:DNA-binding transcriptional regulator YiaG
MKKKITELSANARACPSCGKPMALLGYIHVEDVGGVLVKDGTSLAWQCKSCDLTDLSLEDLAGYERRAAALVLRDGTRVDGNVVRDARKALDLRQVDLASLLGCEPETLSRWESGARPMPRAEQLALVALLDEVESFGVDIREILDRKKSNRPIELEVQRHKTG